MNIDRYVKTNISCYACNGMFDDEDLFYAHKCYREDC